MRNYFDEQLELLNVELIRMGSLCEDAIMGASRTLMGKRDLPNRSMMQNMRSTRRKEILKICALSFC